MSEIAFPPQPSIQAELLANGVAVEDSAPLPIAAKSIIDSNNSSTTLLTGSNSFTGAWTEVLDFVEGLVRVEADVAGTLFFESSNDGVAVSGSAVQVNAGVGATFAIPQFALTARYFRLRYVNGGTDQGSFELAARLNRVNTIFTTAAKQQINDYSRALLVRQVSDPLLDEVNGKQADRDVVLKFGRNAAVGTTEADVWIVGGLYNWLTAASTVRIASGGNAADDASGNNAREITVVGLDENWEEATETIATNGNLASSATTTTFVRVFRAYVSAVGIYGNTNAGDITIESTTGSLAVARIEAGRGQSQLALYTVPAGKVAFIREMSATVEGSKPASVALYMREDADDTTAPMPGFRLQFPFAGLEGYAAREFRTYLGPYAAKTDLTIRATKLSSGTAAVSASMDIVLVDA